MIDVLQLHGLIAAVVQGELTLSRVWAAESLNGSRMISISDAPNHILIFQHNGNGATRVAVCNKTTKALTYVNLPSNLGTAMSPISADYHEPTGKFIVACRTQVSGNYNNYFVEVDPVALTATTKKTYVTGSAGHDFNMVIHGNRIYLSGGKWANEGSGSWKANIDWYDISYTGTTIDSISNQVGVKSIATYQAGNGGKPYVYNGFMYYPDINGKVRKINLSTGAETLLYDSPAGTPTYACQCGGCGTKYYFVSAYDYILREIDLTTDVVSVSSAFANHGMVEGGISSNYNKSGIVTYRGNVYSNSQAVFRHSPCTTEVRLT